MGWPGKRDAYPTLVLVLLNRKCPDRVRGSPATNHVPGRSAGQSCNSNETHRHPYRRRRYAGPQRDDCGRDRARNQRKVEISGSSRALAAAESSCAARASQPAVPHDPGTRSDFWRHDPRRLARLRRRRRRQQYPRSPSAFKRLKHRRLDLHRRRRHAQRHAGLVRNAAHGAGAQDHRQRPRPKLSQRTRRMAPQRPEPTARTSDYSASPSQDPLSTWSRWSIMSTPGYATAVFVSARGVNRIRTTAESHRRIAIIEVMGRHSGLHRAGIELRATRHSAGAGTPA